MDRKRLIHWIYDGHNEEYYFSFKALMLGMSGPNSRKEKGDVSLLNVHAIQRTHNESERILPIVAKD